MYRARCTLGVPWSHARGWVAGRFDGRYKFARYYAPDNFATPTTFEVVLTWHDRDFEAPGSGGPILMRYDE